MGHAGGVNLVAYLRVSTDRQADEGFGLDVQEASIQRWAAGAGHTIVASFRDEGISGAKDLDDRPGLAAALTSAEVAEGIVVAKLDRLARSLTVQEAVLAQAWKHGSRVFSADVGEVLEDDPDDPMRTFVRQVMGAAAQLERGMIAARLRAGRRMKASKGGYAFGSPRFGRRAEERELVADPVEQAVISRMAELRSEGSSLKVVAATLNLEGLRPKRGDRWHPETVRRVLQRLAPPDAA